jgi:hypothetical protein
MAGGMAGLALGTMAITPLLRIAPASIPNIAGTQLDTRVLLFALAHPSSQACCSDWRRQCGRFAPAVIL